MSFIHHHAPQKEPQLSDACIAILGDRLLARPDVSESIILPDFAALSGWNTSGARAPLHVGTIDGRSHWLRDVEIDDTEAPPGWQWHDTRALLTLLTPAQNHAVNCARALLWWERRHRFCGVCGTPTLDVVDERARRCPKCSAQFFPVVSPAIIVAVTRGDELLLAHNRNFRPGMFSVLAGFVDPGESLEQAAVREIREEAGIEVDRLEYVASQPWPFPNSLMIAFRARYVRGEMKVDGDEIEEARWCRRDALPEIPRKGSVARLLIDRWIAEVPEGTARK